MPARRDWTERVPQLRLWCQQQLTLKEMAKRFRSNKRGVKKAIRDFQIPYDPPGWRGPHNSAWRGGKTVSNGYIRVYAPNHPNRDRHNKVNEHVLVMEAKIGRLLNKGERVHHIDGNRKNNVPENLALFASNADHLRETLKGKVPNWTEKGKLRLARVLANRGKDGHMAPIPSGLTIDDLPVNVEMYRRLCECAGAGHIPSKTAPQKTPGREQSEPR